MNCPECGHELIATSEPLQEEFRGEKFFVEGISRQECPNCGEYVIEADQCDRLDDALQEQYRHCHGLLTPEDIQSIRRDLGVSQREFEQMLGVTSPTVCRWETGRIIQTKLADNLMRAIRDHRCVADDAMRRSELHKAPAFSAEACVSFEQNIRNLSTDRSVTYNVQ